MADKKITQLPASTVPLAGTEVLPIVQGATPTTKQVSVANLTAGRAVSATQYTSTIATGTAPLVVASTTEVANLKAATATLADSATSATSANAVKSNATTGLLQITGPAAASTRVMTAPDADFTVARTDAGQTFTGNQIITGDLTNTGNTVLGNTRADTLNVGNGDLIKDASGNLGLGVTPSAWYSGFKGIDISNAAFYANPINGSAIITANTYINSSLTNIYKTSGYALRYTMAADIGSHIWQTAPSGTAGAAISFTQAMTLDASGRLGVATTSPYKSITVGTDNASAWITAGGTNVNLTLSGVGTDGSVVFRTGGTNSDPSTTTERARIDSSGNVGVGTTDTSQGRATMYNGGAGTVLCVWGAGATSRTQINFRNDNGNVGSIVTDGSATAYNTSSDYRLKENIQPMQGALDVVTRLNPVTYTWKVDGSDGQGFIAHELQAVVPDCVTGEKDAVDAEGKPVYQGIDTSFLVATLTKAIQEQQDQINQLKAEITAFKSAK